MFTIFCFHSGCLGGQIQNSVQIPVDLGVGHFLLIAKVICGILRLCGNFCFCRSFGFYRSFCFKNRSFGLKRSLCLELRCFGRYITVAICFNRHLGLCRHLGIDSITALGIGFCRHFRLKDR